MCVATLPLSVHVVVLPSEISPSSMVGCCMDAMGQPFRTHSAESVVLLLVAGLLGKQQRGV